MLDAYTIKKIAPRILIGIILINLSIYIVTAAAEVTRLIANGATGLITAPLKSSAEGDGFTVGSNSSFTTGPAIPLAIGAFFLAKATRNEVRDSSGTIGYGQAFKNLFKIDKQSTNASDNPTNSSARSPNNGALIQWLLLFIVLPVVLLFLSILVTLVFRQGLLVFLAVSAPIAMACYLLPSTEKYFKKWVELFVKTLMVYPIITIIFAISTFLASIIFKNNEGSLPGIIAGVITLFAPMLMIPFAFKLAGGAIGAIYGALSGGSKRMREGLLGNAQNPYSLRNRTKFKASSAITQQRGRAVAAGRASGAGFRRRVIGRALNYGNLQAKESALNKQASDMLQSQIQTGDDSNIRDLFIAWDATANGGNGGWYRRMDMENGRAVAGAAAVYNNYQAGRDAHRKSMSLYGGNMPAVQDALYYEWKKTSFDPKQMGRIENQYQSILGEHRFSEQEGGSMMKGVGFRHQGQSLVSKYRSFNKDPTTGEWGWKTDVVGLTKEAALNIDTYSMSRQDKSTFDNFTKGYTDISQTLANEQQLFDNPSGVITQRGHIFEGKTKEQLEEAKQRLMEIAAAVNPQQQMPGAGRQLAAAEEGGSPQLSAYGGVSNAPVEVQAAAKNFYDTVYPATVSPPQQSPSGGEGIITPDGPNFNIPPGSRPA